MDQVPAWITRWIQEAPGTLSEADIRALTEFGSAAARLFHRRGQHDGSSLSEIGLRGEPHAPTLAVIFNQAHKAPYARYSYDWTLPRGDEPARATLKLVLSNYLGELEEDLSSSPGLPLWDPDEDGLIHVDLGGERYRQWGAEWYARGRPWHDSEGRLRYGSDLAKPTTGDYTE